MNQPAKSQPKTEQKAHKSEIVQRPARGQMTGLPGEGMQRIDMPFMTAMRVQVARDIEEVERGALAEARLMGKDFFYNWDIRSRDDDDGKKEVEGMTIDGAMMLFRYWGNSVCQPELVADTDDHYLMRATFIDLQTGSNFARLYKKTRTAAPGGYAKKADGRQRWADMQFSDAQSRAMRNAISDAVPRWLIRKCVAAARAAAAEGLNPNKERQKIIRRAKKLDISQLMLEQKLRKPMDDWDAHDCVSMQALLRAIDDENATVEDIFGAISDAQATKEVQEQSLVNKFESRLRASISYDDGTVVGQLIAQAVEQKRLTDEEHKHLKKVYGEVVWPMKPKDQATQPSSEEKSKRSAERQPGDDDE